MTRQLAIVGLLAVMISAAAMGDDAVAPKAAKMKCQTVTIGSQEWMAENLDVSLFRNGDPIPQVTSSGEWLAAYQSESPAWCYYNNDPKNGEKYGKLYNWYAVNDSRGLAPQGWHIPTDREWQKLISACGGTGAAFSKLKASDGFAAKPAGARYYEDASFNHMGDITFWWTATKNDKWNAWYHAMHFDHQQVGRDNGGMNTGHSVRCIKDKQSMGSDSTLSEDSERLRGQSTSLPLTDTAPTATKPAAQPTTDSVFKTELDKASYAIGIQIGKNFKQQGTDINVELLAQGLADTLADKALLTDEQAQKVLMAFTEKMRQQTTERRNAEAAESKKKGEAFLAENKAKEGVITTASGLQYRVLTPGTGAMPAAEDVVKVHYKGTLIDGTEFDSSYTRGAPATFKVGGVISGWTEALKLMQVGAKWQLVIPSDLAYGPQGTRGKIGPNAVLIFEVELLSIEVTPAQIQPAR